MPKTSVVMGTFNGEGFLGEQLDSIAKQSLAPDELLVLDDGSRDGSVALARAFSEEVSFPVRVIQNEQNLGYSKNFEKGLRLAEGDLIFFCDQDDYWEPHKVAAFVDKFESNGHPSLVYSDCLLVDGQLRSLGKTLWESLGLDAEVLRELEVAPFEYSLRRPNIFCGQSMAVSRQGREHVLPFAPRYGHDAWIGLVSAALGQIAWISEPLTRYRQHATQVTGSKAPSLRNKLRKRYRGLQMFRDPIYLNNWIEEHEALLHHLKTLGVAPSPALTTLSEKVTYLRATLQMHETGWLRRMPLFFRELSDGRYQRFSHGWKSVVVDLIP